jgi:hypothetical protein
MRALKVMGGGIAALAAGGGLLGAVLGWVVPQYYRTVLHAGSDLGFSPMTAGAGLGFMQGAIAGLVVGPLLALADACNNSRKAAPADAAPKQPIAWDEWVGCALVGALGLIFLTLAGLVVLVVGAILGEGGAYHRRFLEEQQVVAPVLASDPAFAGVEILRYSNGTGVYLMGDVESAEDLERLRKAVTEALVEAKAKATLHSVRVRPK